MTQDFDQADERKFEKQETYGVYLRDPNNYSKLSLLEKRELLAERAWELENPREVAELNALIGRTVRLVRNFRTYGLDEHDKPVEPGAVPAQQKAANVGPTSYLQGRRLRVFARAGRRVLARMQDGVVLQVRKEWVST